MPTAKAPVAPARAPRAAAPAPAAAAAPRRAPKVAPAPAVAPPEEAAPPKRRLSATDEEIAAAVACTLEPRETPGDLDQANLTLRSANDRPIGRPLGVTTGLPIMLAACYVFQQNEKAAPKDKLTDPQIAEWIKSEFPGRDSKVHENIQYCRRLYNAGRLTKNQPPKIESNRFDENGLVSNPTPRQKGVKPAALAAPAAQSPTPRRAPAPAAPAPARAPQRAAKAPAAPAAPAPRAPARRPVAAK